MKTLGEKDRIANMDDDYTRGFILSKRLGVKINSKNLNDLKLKKANDDRVTAGQLAAAKELEAELDEPSATLATKTEESGRAFRFVLSKEIDKAIRDQLGTDIDKKKIALNDPIRFIDSFEVLAELHKEMAARLAVKVAEA